MRANIPGLVESITNGIPTLVDGVRGGGNYSQQTQAYGVAPVIDVGRGTQAILSVTDAVAFVFGVPLFNGGAMPAALNGIELLLVIRNTSGGAHGAGTFNAIFKTAGAVPAIANGSSRSFLFVWNGTNWVESFRSAADVAN